jgi:hypothetical protein
MISTGRPGINFACVNAFTTLSSERSVKASDAGEEVYEGK